MAQRRMIDKRISVSEQVANLALEAQLLFTWMIPHADDVGLLPYSARTIKALVVPMVDAITSESIGFQLESMEKEGLIEVFEWRGERFWRIVKFSETQTLKRDRKPNSIAKGIESWPEVLTIWNPTSSTAEPVGNPSEVKKSKEKNEKKKVAVEPVVTNPFASTACLTDELCKEVAEQYRVEIKPVIKLKESLMLYCKSKGKRFRDYKATLQNWTRRSIDEGKIKTISASTQFVPPPLPDPLSREKWEEMKRLHMPRFSKAI